VKRTVLALTRTHERRARPSLKNLGFGVRRRAVSVRPRDPEGRAIPKIVFS